MKKPWLNNIFLTIKILKIWLMLSHYMNFIQKAIWVIDLEISIKSRWIKPNSQESFDDEVAEKVFLKKLFKKSKLSKLHVDKETES